MIAVVPLPTAVSRPDGLTVAYVGVTGDSRLHLRAMDDFEARTVPETEGANAPFFSPDGKRLCYRSDRRGDDLLQIFVSELAFDHLDAPVQRIGAPFTPVPFAPVLEQQYLPNADDIVAAVREVV